MLPLSLLGLASQKAKLCSHAGARELATTRDTYRCSGTVASSPMLLLKEERIREAPDDGLDLEDDDFEDDFEDGLSSGIERTTYGSLPSVRQALNEHGSIQLMQITKSLQSVPTKKRVRTTSFA